MCPWIQRLIIIHHKFQKQLNNDHSLQFITGTTVDPPANNSDDEEYFDEEEYENDGTPWVCKVDWKCKLLLFYSFTLLAIPSTI